MIRFKCPSCGRPFTVSDGLAGRRAKCKDCGTKMRVPPAAPAQLGLSPRQRRLLADERQLRRAFGDPAGPITLETAEGEPPERYEFAYRVGSLAPGRDGEPVGRGEHRALVTLPADYPRLPPVVAMLTPVFHPNIDPSSVCVGDHWAAGERLADLVVRVGEMLAYQAYNVRSPLDAEAAKWADLNADRLPTDPADLRRLTDAL